MVASSSACLPNSTQQAAIHSVFIANPAPSPLPIVPAPCFGDRFMQPTNRIAGAVDMLFVIHSTGSFYQDMNAIAGGIDGFVANLPPDIDFRFSVLLAEAPDSPLGGKLFSPQGVPTVLDSKSMTIAQIRQSLQYTVTHSQMSNPTHGEEGLRSMYSALTDQLTYNQNLGFFRSNAALAVVFMANEGDQCSLPAAAPGDADGIEEAKIAARDCHPNGIDVNASSVLNLIKNYQGDRPYAIGTVAYTDPATANGINGNYEAEYGYGYVDIASLSSGVVMNIQTGNFTQGLATIGNLLAIKLQLYTDFTLSRKDVDPASIQAYVDGAKVSSSYVASINEVHPGSYGKAGSVIDITYCSLPMVQPTVPSPTPSPTPCTGVGCGGGKPIIL